MFHRFPFQTVADENWPKVQFGRQRWRSNPYSQRQLWTDMWWTYPELVPALLHSSICSLVIAGHHDAQRPRVHPPLFCWLHMDRGNCSAEAKGSCRLVHEHPTITHHHGGHACLDSQISSPAMAVPPPPTTAVRMATGFFPLILTWLLPNCQFPSSRSTG